MKRFLTIASIISIMLFSFGSAHAVQGVADDVPGVDTIIPFICEVGGTQNTLWAVAEVAGAAGTADILVFDEDSFEIYDSHQTWTPFDIVSGDCQTLVAGMSTVQKSALTVTISGTDYYVGYLVYFNDAAVLIDQFVPWAYLVDLPNGFASGFNAYAAEGCGVNLASLGELDAATCAVTSDISAFDLFPRYFLLNDKPDTWNWWIILKGNSVATDNLGGFICNEDEDCISLSIPVPHEMNVIDAGTYLPVLPPGTFPKAGMGIFAANFLNYPAETVLGWSYQRQQADTLAATWDVIHPMHRNY